jgi:hypothetical protein
MAMFDQYAGQTGWSPVDLRQRFYDGLNDQVKDALAGTHQPIGTIDELRAAAQSLDQCWWQREAEKKGHTFTLGNPKPSDPNAMQVDATRQDNSCHGSARTPLGTHANGEDSGLEESRKAIRT